MVLVDKKPVALLISEVVESLGLVIGGFVPCASGGSVTGLGVMGAGPEGEVPVDQNRQHWLAFGMCWR